MEKNVGNCPICSGPGINFFDARIADELHVRYSVEKCSHCGTNYTAPQPTPEDLKVIYSDEYWDATGAENIPDGKRGLVSRFNSLRQTWSIRPFLSILPSNARVLDVGCGAGHLAEILVKNGFCVQVTEVSERMLRSVMQRLRVKGYKGNLDTLQIDPGFDAVVFNHVLEHVPAPMENMQVAFRILKPGGYLYIELPNIASLQFALFRERWFPLEIPSHLTHFSARTLDAVAFRAGFSLSWRSFFSPHASAAGIVVSAFPTLHPRVLRKARGIAKIKLVIYFSLQVIALPLALFEAVLRKGGIMRTIYKKPS